MAALSAEQCEAECAPLVCNARPGFQVLRFCRSLLNPENQLRNPHTRGTHAPEVSKKCVLAVINYF